MAEGVGEGRSQQTGQKSTGREAGDTPTAPPPPTPESHWLVEREVRRRRSCSAQSLSCIGLCNPVDYNLPGSSVHGISQARMLEGQ